MIPVTVVVSLAISAYKEMPVSVENRTVTASQPEPDKNLIIPKPAEPTKSVTRPLETKSKNTSKESASLPVRNENIAPPPPPPPPAGDVNNKAADEKTAEDEVPFVVVEEMPMFPGGDAELLKYIGSHTQYPEQSKINNIQGRVIVRFCVTALGGVSQASILKGVDPELDTEALRVVNTLPAFKPGKQGGKPVPVWYMVPITFTLK